MSDLICINWRVTQNPVNDLYAACTVHTIVEWCNYLNENYVFWLLANQERMNCNIYRVAYYTVLTKDKWLWCGRYATEEA